MADVPTAGGFDYLRTQAIARLYLDNFPNIQSSWVTQGPRLGQVGLFFGANDMGSLMLEENVVAAAGTIHYLTLEQLRQAIRAAGYVPRQRNVFYKIKELGSGVWGQGSEEGCCSSSPDR
jgi:cyclic dehypoxanthinyl futalosine synthase